MRRPRFWLVLLAALVLAAAVPGIGRVPAADAALTDRVVRVRSLHSVAPSSRTTTVYATCPDQTRPVGAGVSLLAGPRSFRLRGSRLVPRDGKYAAGIILQNVGSETLSVTVYAVCWRATSGVFYPSESRSVAPGTIANQAAGCPGGTRIGGAGWGYSNAAGDYALPVRANYPFDGGWAVTVDNRFDGATTSSMSAYASCVTNAALGAARPQDVRQRVVVGASKRLTTFVPCPAGGEIAAGGFILPYSGAVLLASSLPTVSGDREGWEVSVVNRSTTSETFDAMAVCLVFSIPPPL